MPVINTMTMEGNTMTLTEISRELRAMYDNAGSKEKVVMIHLFGIKYADQIERSDLKAKDIVLAAGLPESYHTEVHKGIRLSRYVIIK